MSSQKRATELLEELESTIDGLEKQKLLHRSFIDKVREPVKLLGVKVRNLEEIERCIEAIREEILRPVAERLEVGTKFSRRGFVIGIIGIFAGITAAFVANYYFYTATQEITSLQEVLELPGIDVNEMQNFWNEFTKLKLSKDDNLSSVNQYTSADRDYLLSRFERIRENIEGPLEFHFLKNHNLKIQVSTFVKVKKQGTHCWCKIPLGDYCFGPRHSVISCAMKNGWIVSWANPEDHPQSSWTGWALSGEEIDSYQIKKACEYAPDTAGDDTQLPGFAEILCYPLGKRAAETPEGVNSHIGLCLTQINPRIGTIRQQALIAQALLSTDPVAALPWDWYSENSENLSCKGAIDPQ
ncbi:MAG: hypothetical protein GY835_22435 [bacterium]|nr:hypothetical protein [bacterium]